jgi:hypothetical protein
MDRWLCSDYHYGMSDHAANRTRRAHDVPRSSRCDWSTADSGQFVVYYQGLLKGTMRAGSLIQATPLDILDMLVDHADQQPDGQVWYESLTL